VSVQAEWISRVSPVVQEDVQLFSKQSTDPRPQLQKAVVALARTFILPAESNKAIAKRQQRWRGLRIGNLGLLVEHDSGGEIIEDAKVFALPRAGAWCRGLINLRGHLIPAIDLHELIGLTHQRASQQWWLALGRGEEALAFPIDALPNSLTAQEPTEVHSTLVPEALRAYSGSGYRIDGLLWLEFRHRDFFKTLARL
jgi:chemotaxis signal transduction protein